jgi:hypothetical protein
MISYGSRHDCAAMPMEGRSHQLGEGHKSVSEVPSCAHPPRLVYGSQRSDAEMPMRDCSQGEGHQCGAAMPPFGHPSQPVYGSQSHGTEMSHLVRSHQLGEGQINHAAVSLLIHPSRPVYGRDTSRSQQCQMKRSLPTSLREPLLPRSNAHLWSLPLIYQGKGHHAPAEMPFMVRPSPPVLGHPRYAERPHPLRPILTRGQHKNAAMPKGTRLATKEIRYGYKI